MVGDMRENMHVSLLFCARGDTTGGRIGLALLTQILKGCGSTC